MLGKMRAEAFDLLQERVLCKVVLSEDSCVEIPLDTEELDDGNDRTKGGPQIGAASSAENL